MFTGSASNKNTLRILPPLTITKAEVDLFLTAFQSSLKALNYESLHIGA
jgi:acetylornithine aminotransferase